MRKRERVVLAILAVVVTAVVTCALFVCKEFSCVKEAFDKAGNVLAPPPGPITIEQVQPQQATRAEAVSRDLAPGRTYRRRGLAPIWTMRPQDRVRPSSVQSEARSGIAREPWAPAPEAAPR